MEMIRTAPHMKCRQCQRVLFPYESDGMITYHHASYVIDHDPVPVPQDGLVQLVCDFCTTPVCGAWDFETQQFLEDPTDTRAGYVDDGAWCACETCRDLIVAARWGKLTERAERKLWPEIKASGIPRGVAVEQIGHMHKAFQDNWTGKEPTYVPVNLEEHLTYTYRCVNEEELRSMVAKLLDADTCFARIGGELTLRFHERGAEALGMSMPGGE